MYNRPSKSASVIRSLTSFINNNRKEIRSTFKLSACITASIILLIVLHPFIVAVCDLLTAAWADIKLIGTLASNAIETGLKTALDWGMNFISELAASINTTYTEWMHTRDVFQALSTMEKVQVIIERFGYLGTSAILFLWVASVIISFKIAYRIGYRFTTVLYCVSKQLKSDVYANNGYVSEASPQVMAIVKEYRDKHQND